MMRRLLLIVVLTTGIGCDGVTYLKGYIVDGDGNPIPDATVTLTQDGNEVGIEETSAEDGSFDVGGAHAPTSTPLDFHVHKDGYLDDVRRVPPESKSNLRIVLQRENPEPEAD